MSQTPTIGRIVHYKLGPSDVAQIETRRNVHPHLISGNRVEVGQVYPAMIVRTWGEGSTTVQLQIFLDGNDSHWGSSRTEGDGEYQWTWPQR